MTSQLMDIECTEGQLSDAYLGKSFWTNLELLHDITKWYCGARASAARSLPVLGGRVVQRALVDAPAAVAVGRRRRDRICKR